MEAASEKSCNADQLIMAPIFLQKGVKLMAQFSESRDVEERYVKVAIYKRVKTAIKFAVRRYPEHPLEKTVDFKTSFAKTMIQKDQAEPYFELKKQAAITGKRCIFP